MYSHFSEIHEWKGIILYAKETNPTQICFYHMVLRNQCKVPSLAYRLERRHNQHDHPHPQENTELAAQTRAFIPLDRRFFQQTLLPPEKTPVSTHRHGERAEEQQTELYDRRIIKKVFGNPTGTGK